jgi:cobalt/nickel transport system permease protein
LKEPYQAAASPLHSLDARVKLILSLCMLVLISLTPFQAWASYILFLAVALSLALTSRLGMAFVLKRSLLALPFALAALPLIFSGSENRILLHIAQFQIPINLQGLERFIGILLKSWISLQIVILLVATSPFFQIQKAFRFLKAPELLVSVIGLMWRYLFVISDEAMRMIHARDSRSSRLPGAKHSGGSLLWRARVTGGMAGSLFLRSIERSERVYAAMLARGYNGSLPPQKEQAMTMRDLALLWLGIGFLVLIWLLGLWSLG